MIDEKIARVKALIRKREEIDAELAALFGGAAPAKRGRPRKETAPQEETRAGSAAINRQAGDDSSAA